jgi:hypothetical protein
MPQIIILAAIVVGGWYAWKFVKREMARVDRELEAARNRPTETLKRDPETGRYRINEKEPS